MIHITSIEIEPIEQVSFLTIPQGDTEPKEFSLPIYRGRVTGLPDSIQAIIVTSDLQGVVYQDEKEVLLGIVVADTIKLIFDVYFPDIQRSKIVAFLCGDLYADLIKRGQSGSPIDIWRSFSSAFGWTVGIAGNHDEAENLAEEINSMSNTRILINDSIEITGLQIAGLSGIIGRPDKNFRLNKNNYLKSLSSLLSESPDIILTHLSPEIMEEGFQGSGELTKILETGNQSISFCGHSHWNSNQPYLLKNKTQVLNADTKVFILINSM